MPKTHDAGNDAIRVLQDHELDAVIGGVIDGCIRLPVLTPVTPNPTWTFKDVFAKHTIG